jgi:acetate CoA/acetoacetate CoA-transferase alpha subunit
MRTVSVEEAVALIPDGASIMVGGFMAIGTPERLLDELVRQKKTNLTLISNDAAVPGKGVGKLFDGGQVARLTLAVFLCSEAASQIRGAALPVDGAWTAQCNRDYARFDFHQCV